MRDRSFLVLVETTLRSLVRDMMSKEHEEE